MKINILTTLFFLYSSFCYVFGQSDYGYYKNNEFIYELPVRFEKEKYEGDIKNEDSSYVLLDRSILSYEFVNGYYKRKSISHKVYYIGNDSDIEDINKLYLYAGRSPNSLKVSVRTTTSDGHEIDLDESKMEDVFRENGAENYKILAISGIEKRSWVEVLVKRGDQSNHQRFSVSNPFLTIRAEVYFHASDKVTYNYSNKVVRFKYYGDFQQAKWIVNEDSSEVNQFTINLKKNRGDALEKPMVTAENISPKPDESYSHEYENYAYLDLTDLEYTWREAGEGIGSNIFNEIKYETNGLKYIKGLELDGKSSAEKIYAIERFIKQEIKETKSGNSEFSTTKKIWKKRIANEMGLVKMMDQMCNAAGLKYSVYLCSDKDYVQIDPSFAFTRGLDNTLFFFPDDRLYLIPTNNYYYAGRIPNILSSVNALVIKGRYTMADLGDVKRLPDARKEQNIDGTMAVIYIDPIDEMCTVKKTRFLFGDRATRSRGHYHFSDNNERNEYLEGLLLSDLEMELSDVEIRNESIDLNFNSSDTVFYSGVLKGSEMISNIPNGFILNPGAVIGTQTSFYETEERISEIYIPESKTYKHTILVNIPEGYAVEGTENLEFDEKYHTEQRWLYGETRDDAKPLGSSENTAEFISKATIEGDHIRIEIDEYYIEGFYPKEGMAELQKVVNAAYEFFIAKIKFVEI
ncbi:MAG: hypothetical protein ACFHU9_00425 [Fluviicola sp.]